MSYLYAASIQGIQSYIFKTGKLREIAGASELVNYITKNIIEIILEGEYNEQQLVRAAAGNIVYICNKEEVARKLAKDLPKKVSEISGGEITISQTITSYNKGELAKKLQEIDIKLKTQRNKNSLQGGFGFMGIERARRTGDPASYFEKNEAISEATKYKIDLYSITNEDKDKLSKTITNNPNLRWDNIPYDFNNLVKDSSDQWMAVIHADGNGLGNIIQNLFSGEHKDEDIQKRYKEFSSALDNANILATQSAYRSLHIDDDIKTIPIRPIILGGDDLTVIIRADLAFDFTTKFLEEFEKYTQEKLSSINIADNLSACAGIAYIKSSYPIYYGLHLAEALCKDAKKMVKNGKTKNFESALAFYKVKESFIDDLSTLKDRTLKIKNNNKDIDLYFGPYYLKDKERVKNSVGYIRDKLSYLSALKADTDNDKPSISNLRDWLSELYKNSAAADLMMNRIRSNNPELTKKLDLEKVLEDNKTIIYDLLTLYSFIK